MQCCLHSGIVWRLRRNVLILCGSGKTELKHLQATINVKLLESKTRLLTAKVMGYRPAASSFARKSRTQTYELPIS